jgi:hypothetical protein
MGGNLRSNSKCGKQPGVAACNPCMPDPASGPKQAQYGALPQRCHTCGKTPYNQGVRKILRWDPGSHPTFSTQKSTHRLPWVFFCRHTISMGRRFKVLARPPNTAFLEQSCTSR